MKVLDTQKLPDGKIVHLGEVSGELSINEEITARVDAKLRKDTARNHSATHLLHKALKEVLGIMLIKLVLWLNLIDFVLISHTSVR